ncbi:laccase lcc5 [Guyanagaster necrorhizus]|uniref:laccase n=1 Tax=Guyanagaster necrorhizus TaxID=856835 RepID=A0A9P7VRN9_9AGAR|nr:laccase lcc5 [Guyanagaster necrorhizus MCA 3950]KAG7444704.1 laccase lcc5 [Guyanagaster necrorhizus MCA 3950]
MAPRFSALLGFALLFATAPAYAKIGPTGDLVIANSEISPDGYSRVAALPNGVLDGTLISGNKGDIFQLNVVNNLSNNSILQSTSIHWHGLLQKGSNWADGPAFVNQCPIAKGDSFLYTFDSADQAGTFWYHSHLSTQYCDGLRGPFIIYDPNDPHADLYDVDDESTILTLSDWYHTPAKEISFPTPDSTLINGLGRWSKDPTSDLAVITVEQGKRYRFRMIDMACESSFTFAIEGHLMTIIEVDGVNHQPYTVDQIQIFAGQRYSFVLNANQEVDNYWIRALPSVGTFGYTQGINSAILRYSGAAEGEPATTTISSVLKMNETELVPFENPGAPGTPEIGGVDYALNLAFAFTSNRTYTVNGAQFTAPSTPVLLQVLSGAKSAGDLLPTGSVFPLPSNSTIEVSMPGGVVGGGHPFHLHGHTFDVVRSAGSSVYNYDNPVRRDVVNIGTKGDNVTIRFRTDNPGPWFLHCHIDWHLEAGLAVVFAEDTDSWTNTIDPTEQWDNLCPQYKSMPESDL